MSRFQRRTALKAAPAERRDTLRNADFLKTFTVIECSVRNLLQLFGELHGFESLAAAEYRISDCCDRIRNLDLFQLFAAAEDIVTDIPQRFRQFHRGDI